MNPPSLAELEWKSIRAGSPEGPLWVKVSSSQWQEYITISSYKCEHTQKELRERLIKNGAIQWREQCLICGRSTSNALRRESGRKIPAWDETLEAAYERKIEEQRSKLEGVFVEQTLAIETGRDVSYNSYLASDDWKQKRSIVLERDKYLCQGCLKEPATEVHHLNYDDVPNELMFDLVSLCRSCHERVHRRKLARLEKLKAISK